jgi:HAD superfamily hydrolase (TIGR01509 family)
MKLYDKKFWIFDLDGTLTVPIHDFDEIRRLLSLEPGKGILESLADIDETTRQPLIRVLDEHEYELAEKAVAAPGAADLLADLSRRRIAVGILTRNNHRNLERTLERTGLAKFVDPSFIRTRENSKPKPHPDGIHQLLACWGADCSDTVMIGNHRIDVETGRAAGVDTVFVDPGEPTEIHRIADIRVRTLAELAP